jgi:hypothetical protein
MTKRIRIDLEPVGAREFVADIIQRGDYVRIAPDFHNNCTECDYEIGIDYEMHDYEGRWWWVDRVCDKDAWSQLPCGCRVFEIDEWFFSTCWIDAIEVIKPAEPAWEL